MLKQTLIVIFLCVSGFLSLEIEDLIWPKPQIIKKGNEAYAFSQNCQFGYQFKSNYNPNSFILDQMLKIYLENYLGESKVSLNKENCRKLIDIKIKNFVYIIPYPKNQTQAQGVEFYKLKISKSGIKITVNYYNGVIRALETLSQILTVRPNRDFYEIPSTPLVIIDYPIYAIRGVMIDCSRHFISISKLKQIIDGMMHSKLNTFHWHLTDDDNFGFESKVIPTIIKNQQVYTQNQIRDLMQYAKVRGVQIIAEFDQPGHTRSWGEQDELKNITLRENQTEYGFFNPAENMTFNVAVAILNEAIKIFKSQENSLSNNLDYFHLGGDEIVYSIWLKNPQIIKFMLESNYKDEYDLLNFYFNKIRINIPQNKNYIYWIDSDFFKNNKFRNLESFKLDNTIFHYWGTTQYLLNFTNLNHFLDDKLNVILSPSDYTYLDCGTASKYGDNSWCDPYITWKKIYNFNPNLYNKNHINVLGSIACLWTELVDDDNVIGKVFPRASALGERLWSNIKTNEEIDIKKVFVRLTIFNKRLKSMKIPSSVITNKLCENRPEDCVNQIK